MRLIDADSALRCGWTAATVVLVACSGGADSTALLLECARLRNEGSLQAVCAAHVLHGIRGAEAERDAAFVKALCAKQNVDCRFVAVDAPSYAKEAGLSLETAARELRRTALEAERLRVSADTIALAHQREDQAETLLMHLSRGCALKGLVGMQPVTGCVSRPLLDVSRTDILHYLAESGQDYIEDSTNADDALMRNHFRHRILPPLTIYNPRAVEAIAGASKRFWEDETYLTELAKAALISCKGSRKALSALPKPLRYRALRELLSDAPLLTENDLSRLDALLTKQSGRSATLCCGQLVQTEGDALVFNAAAAQSYELPLPIGVRVRTPYGTMEVLHVEKAHFPCAANDAYVDANAARGALRLRSPRAGDRFTPFGMKGTKLLSDYFTDKGVARGRRVCPLVCDDAGILLVTGHTIAERARVTKDTKNILCFHYEEDTNDVG